MKVKDLPYAIKKLAKKRRKQKPDDGCPDTGGFYWESTKEGHYFWEFANALERERKEIAKQAIDASIEEYHRGYDQACKDIIKRLKAIGHKELKGL